MVTPAARREAVAHLVEVHEMSERRACQVISAYWLQYLGIGQDDRTMHS